MRTTARERRIIGRRSRSSGTMSFRALFGRLTAVAALVCIAIVTAAVWESGRRPVPAAQRDGRVPTAFGTIAEQRDGFTVSRDPLTGELKAPAAEKLQALRLGSGASRSSEGLREIMLPDGTVALDLQGRFRSFSVAKLGKDGSIVTGCVTSENDAERFLRAAANQHGAHHVP